ncbi:MAG: hypothetical protein J6A81_03125, partial [Peptococcaceae bacterium]|nr:hypothetical protein [Peptococcaceae bacterium]
MRREFSEKELKERVKLNQKRLTDSYYQIESVFEDTEGWPGDKQGRALLAFVSHYKIDGTKIPCMEQMISCLNEKTNKDGYFGELASEMLNEQQLSGHSWYLRGLCEYYEQFKDKNILSILKSTVEHLYYPTQGRYKTYPIERGDDVGGVSGHVAKTVNGWKLSTDICCAFMSIDGLSHYYALTHDMRTKEILDEMITVFAGIDKIKVQAQTHCSLSAARGMLRMYRLENDKFYLEAARQIFELYLSNGMTYTNQNFNWWGKGDTWTEPCAVVDSLMVATELFKLTGDERWQTFAACIAHNGFASIQRANGGAGTDTTVSTTTHVLKMSSYEAPFCCTMRLAEGLWYIA